ncbi:hypothetical protein [Pedobacter foliorum]|uniref:hypothetical protein n=1 Tax=Pedobacter foliorum TaxID=2739058 RepID=UPI0015679D76|nr:hypothetical protein [Pedobacter foliorum]NRF38360.1 hypothetical protein [Pedobacter foliorum]
MKRLFIGLFATGVALGASTFTSLASKRRVATYYYVLTSSGFYRETEEEIDPANCLGNANHKCYVAYSTSQGTSFPVSAMPSVTPIAQSANNGLYIP